MRAATAVGVIATALYAGSPATAPPEIEAKNWINAPAPRLFDQRDVLLVFCEPTDADIGETVRRANRLAVRRDLMVIGLTKASRPAVEAMAQRYRPRFAIGTASSSGRAFGVRRTPHFVLIRRAGSGERRELQASELSGLEPKWLRENLPPDESAETGDLMEFITSPADSLQRRAAVKDLYDRMSAAEFAAYAEEVLQREQNPDVRNRVEYWRRVAAGERMEDQVRAPSMVMERAFDQNPDDPAWGEAREVRAHPPATAAAAVEIYEANAGSDVVSTLKRKWAVDALAGLEDREGVRAACMRLLPEEPDFGIRCLLTSALVQRCDVGDTEAVALLEKMAAQETNIYHARPWMENAVIYLRTGAIDTAAE
jgi:hypothetical protein